LCPLCVGQPPAPPQTKVMQSQSASSKCPLLTGQFHFFYDRSGPPPLLPPINSVKSLSRPAPLLVTSSTLPLQMLAFSTFLGVTSRDCADFVPSHDFFFDCFGRVSFPPSTWESSSVDEDFPHARNTFFFFDSQRSSPCVFSSLVTSS